jgi:LacI family transcriptional regulator
METRAVKTFNKRPTMRDVAALAGVSIKTVSRVVNNEYGVAPETRDKVRQAIASLGFRENEIARNLRSGVLTHTIGLIIEDISNPFYSSIAKAIDEVCKLHNYMVIMASSEEDPDLERNLVYALVKRRVDGLIIVPASKDHKYLINELRNVPMVFIDRPPQGIHVYTVLIDNEGGAREAATFFVKQGFSNIAVIADNPNVYTTQVRVLTFLSTLKEYGIEIPKENIYIGSHDAKTAEKVASGFLSRSSPPDAIFATNNRNAIGVLKAIRANSVRPFVIGFDDFEVSDLTFCPIGVVSYDECALGRIAAQVLFDQLLGHEDTSYPEIIQVPTTLVIKGHINQ